MVTQATQYLDIGMFRISIVWRKIRWKVLEFIKLDYEEIITQVSLPLKFDK